MRSRTRSMRKFIAQTGVAELIGLLWKGYGSDRKQHLDRLAAHGERQQIYQSGARALKRYRLTATQVIDYVEEYLNHRGAEEIMAHVNDPLHSTPVMIAALLGLGDAITPVERQRIDDLTHPYMDDQWGYIRLTAAATRSQLQLAA